jgi:hypothetical protein
MEKAAFFRASRWRAFSLEPRARSMHIEKLIPQIKSFDITELKNLMTKGNFEIVEIECCTKGHNNISLPQKRYEQL